MTGDNKHILLFDGVCNLCDSTVQFVNKRDRKNQFLFESLQSAAAQELLKSFGDEFLNLESMVLISNGQPSTKSTAALNISGILGYPYALAQVFFIVPRPIRDAVYDIVATYRYKWFGQKETCELDPNFQHKIYGRSSN